MEAAKLRCIGSPLSLCLSRSNSSRGTCGNRVLCALKSSSSPTSSLPCDRPPSAFPQLSILSVVGALANIVCLPALAAEEALESSLSSLSSSSAAEAASMQVSESAGASTSVKSAVQSSLESAKAAAAADAGDGNLIINTLGAASFIGLSLLTIGVAYLAITDFLEKRKGDEEAKKLNEEAAASAKKKQSGSLTAASRGGAKGFGKKRGEEE